ncbi:MAG: tyrosine-protein phosphatase [Phycisphaerales bacterium]|nr:tyrosine-protein phosphatase [Hyphomonadaceae bacterium]
MTDAEDKKSRFDLATPQGRRRAEADLIWTDHGFLRSRFANFHWIEDGVMARANQPSPEAVARYAEMGFKTILNLRGPSDTGYYALEREACERHGLSMIDARMHSREPPSVEQIRQAKRLFETIAYPALMHCKSGADRAGVMAVLYKHFKMGLPISEAAEQLSLKYLHVKQGKTGMIDYFFAAYLAETKESGKAFMDWVEQDYDKAKVKAAFMGEWWANILVDKILRRE